MMHMRRSSPRSPRGIPAQVRLYHSAGYQSTNHYTTFDGVAGAGLPPPAAAKRGGLKFLVSKFENMASSNKKPDDPPMKSQPNGLGTKGRGWRGAVGLKKKEEIRSSGGFGDVQMERVDSLEFAKSMRADEIKLERKPKEGSDGSVKSQNSLIVRGKKEGRRLLNGLSGRMSRENRSGGEAKGKAGRRESLVQIRVRAFETVKGAKAPKDRPSVLREEVSQISPYRAPPPPTGSDNSANLTPTTTHTQGSSGGRSGRQRQKLQKPQPISSKPKQSSNLLPKADTSAKESVASSQLLSVDGNGRKSRGKVLQKKRPESRARQRSHPSSETSVHDMKGDGRAHVPSEAQVFSLAARADRGAPRKSVAPTIRERIGMFESAKEVKSTSIVALLGAGATAALKLRIADEGKEDGAELKDIIRRVEYGRSEERLMSPQTGTLEQGDRPGEQPHREKSKSPVSRYLEERKRSSISTQGSGDGKVNGKYISSFAGRRSGVTSPETTRAVFQAVKISATPPKKRSQAHVYGLPTSQSSPARLNKFAKSPVVERKQSPALSPAFQEMIIRRQSERNALSVETSRHTSRQPSPHSMDGHNSVAKRAATPVLGGGPVRPASALPTELVAPPNAPRGTPPGTIDGRVAELIKLAGEDDTVVVSKGVAEDWGEVERMGSAMGGMREVKLGEEGGSGRVRGKGKLGVGDRARTPLQRSKSSLGRMLGRDGPAWERGKEDAGAATPTGTTGASASSSGENKENIPSGDDSSDSGRGKGKGGEGKEGKERAGVGRTVSDQKRKEEIRREEERTLVVRSEVVISEPKPLRLVEISRMLRMARFGRSRSGRGSEVRI